MPVNTSDGKEYNVIGFIPPRDGQNIHRTGDIQWKIHPNITPKDANNDDDMKITFECIYYQTSNLWQLDVDIFLGVHTISDSKAVWLKKENLVFNCIERSVTFDFGNFKTLRESISENDEDLNILRIYAVIKFKDSTVGVRQLPFSYFSYSMEFDDEILLFADGLKFYADKYVLMYNSTVFREMLKNGTKIITIDVDVSFTDVVRFFRFLYQHAENMTTERIDKILMLATRYDVQFLVSDCEDFLLSTDEISIVEKLRIAEKYGLSRLQLVALEKITDTDIEMFYGISTKTLQALLKKSCILEDAGTNT